MVWWRKSKRPAGTSRTQSKVHTESACIIIGAGHVGLSVARGLRALGIEPIIIEQNSRIGDSWRYRYERLHLHHVTDAMHLPGVKYPEHVPRYLSRLDLADYLEGYALLHGLDVRLDHRVLALQHDAAEGWTLTVERAGSQVTFTTDQVVLAAGATGITPRVPELAGRDTWLGRILHSKEYVNADTFRGEQVLVVGSGNSAIEILYDLHDHEAKPAMLMRGGNSWVTREGFAYYHRALIMGTVLLKYVPFVWLLAPLVMRGLDRFFMFDVKRRYGDLNAFGVETDPTPPMLRMAKTGGAQAPSYIDGTWGDVGVALFDLIRDGHVATFKNEIDHLAPDGKTVVFADGQQAEFNSVILCTGFEPVMSHYATFVDSNVMQAIAQRGLQPWQEVPGYAGLWPALGGIATSRYGLQVLARRIAARIRGRALPRRVLNPVISFVLAGPDPGLIQVPRRTIAINVLAVVGLLLVFSTD